MEQPQNITLIRCYRMGHGIAKNLVKAAPTTWALSEPQIRLG